MKISKGSRVLVHICNVDFKGTIVGEMFGKRCLVDLDCEVYDPMVRLIDVDIARLTPLVE